MMQVAIAMILRYGLQDEVRLSHSLAIILVVFVCIYVAGWCWAWGPCQWLLPSEIFPLETRSAGLSIEVSVNFLFNFVIIQSFLSMLCSLKWGLFVFFAIWNFFMPFLVFLYVPETKGVPIEEMELVWKRHWFWKRFMPVDNYIDNPPEKPWNKTASNLYVYVTFKQQLTCFSVANGVQFELGKIQTTIYVYHKVVKARWCAYLCLDSLVQHVYLRRC